MMRDSPCDEPLVCPRGNASRPSTRRPRLATWYVAALPIAPRPTVMTSYMSGTASWLNGWTRHARRVRCRPGADGLEGAAAGGWATRLSLPLVGLIDLYLSRD